ncbi:hypothetical protein ONS95_005680 [Cadophora gregata]|uniref:uncharacterized protein n=1 Tax=Cadophora gregata TaxID=51156 RepID=UPI0026DBEC5E|nr:uncharacterized protein ONS95_005680 [Cadophora gregata]KAK0103669.1 hypothetical protein ONS95_005680 [Cadophora gregata]KAK0107862.1 hypothetical protein ONS96_003652 [Cadophora gregata f. sp. sojae]
MTECATLELDALDSQQVNYTDRTTHWIKTGEHLFDASFVEVKVTGSTLVTEVQHSLTGPHDDSDLDSVDLLVGFKDDPLIPVAGAKDDPLIPSTEQIHHTFLRCQKIWQNYVASAISLPPGCVAAVAIYPDILLQQIPPLPWNLPRKRSISGEAVWHIPKPELPRAPGLEDWNPDEVHGVKKEFLLSISKATEFRTVNPSDPRLNDTRPNGIAILVPL